MESNFKDWSSGTQLRIGSRVLQIVYHNQAFFAFFHKALFWEIYRSSFMSNQTHLFDNFTFTILILFQFGTLHKKWGNFIYCLFLSFHLVTYNS